MRSRVKRATRTNEPLLTNRKEVHVNLNDDDQEETKELCSRAQRAIPLEYNFSTQNASLNGKTYTFSFPDMWRTSKNKNIIGIRKISYFKGRSELRFTLGFIWTYPTSKQEVSYIDEIHNKFSSDAMMADITDFLNNCITEMYAHVKRDYNNTELQHLYKFDYQNNILTVKKMNIGEEIKIDHEFIMLADDKNITEREKTFFKLHHYPVEYKRIYSGSDIPKDLYYYDLNHYSEYISERKADCKVCCSFVPQSDIQFVGIVGDTFIPIKYYYLINENRYFTMNLKTNDNEDIVLPGLENDSLIIEAQLL